MNIYQFINSKDIRKHLESINYRFSAMEAAWLIYNCHRLCYEEKKKAWQEVIADMPDCKVPKRLNCAGFESLHEMIRQYIKTMDAELEDFYSEKEPGRYVYTYEYLHKDDSTWSEEHCTIFSTLEACIESYHEWVDDNEKIVFFRIKRQSLIDTEESVEIECFGNEKPINFIYHNGRNEKAKIIMEYSFEGMWFDFPTPFKKGDIVWTPPAHSGIRWDGDGGFVLTDLGSWNPTEFIRKKGDSSDMNAVGYFVNENGTIYVESSLAADTYMDIEFYEGPYAVNERILPALSQYVKGEVSLDFLLCAYRKTLLDVAADDIMLTNWYPHDKLEKLGII